MMHLSEKERTANGHASKLKALVIIPAFNEEKSILKTVQDLKKSGWDYVVINDGSTDNTRQVCEKNNIPILNLPYNLGIGGAVQTGHKYAFLKGYDVDIQFDGDGQHNASYIKDLLQEIEAGNDLVIGSRFVGAPKNEKNISSSADATPFRSTALRRLGIKWLSFWIHLFCGVRVYDPTSGFRATGKKALKLFAATYPSDYPEPESIVEAAKKSLKIKEIPVRMNPREEGSSSIGGLGSLYYMLKVSLEIFIVAIFRRKEVW